MTAINNMLATGHILIKVDDLKLAVKEFESLGFTVVFGAKPSVAYNAMIYLADGIFLELFQLPKVNVFLRSIVRVGAMLGSIKLQRLWRYLCLPAGYVDYAMNIKGDFSVTLNKITNSGLALAKTKKMSRTNLEGVLLKWFLAAPKITHLPFLMSEYDPLIPPGEAQISHENGAVAVLEINITSTAWDCDLGGYSRLLGIDLKSMADIKNQSVQFKLENVTFKLVSGAHSGISSMTLVSSQPECKQVLHCQGAEINILPG